LWPLLHDAVLGAVATDLIHAGENRDNLRGAAAIKRIDSSSVLFFLGILLAVAGLESANILSNFALVLDQLIPSREIVAVAIGLVSAVLDNVPLVQATIGMYSLDQAPVDSALWQLDALCAGIGGSILIIGSASGVALLGMEKVTFGWYLKTVSLPALVGFCSSVAIYLAASHLHPVLASGGLG
jgi:Na+/H+ antiporter NhaD/arsenite permease-like protein